MNKSLNKATLFAGSSVIALASLVSVALPVSADACLRSDPTVSVVGSSTVTGYAGAMRMYTLDVTNNDSVDCDVSQFGFGVSKPAGWLTDASPDGWSNVAPGQTVQVNAYATPDAAATPDTYGITFTAYQGYSASTVDAYGYASLAYEVQPGTEPDTTAPVVDVVAPANGATVKRNRAVAIQVAASDNVGVTNLTYKVNGVTVCSGSGSLTSCQWTPTQRATYTIEVTASDAAGNSATSSVTVDAR